MSEPQYLPNLLQLTLPSQQPLQFPLHCVLGAVHGVGGEEGLGGVGCKKRDDIMKRMC